MKDGTMDRKTPQKNETKTILVGTYRKDQLEKWILPERFYNYPVHENDAAIRAAAPGVVELWLYLGKTDKLRFSARFDKEISAAELDAMGYPQGMGAHHGERYLLFRVAPLEAEAAKDAKGAKKKTHAKSTTSAKGRGVATPPQPHMLIRLEDFAHDDEELQAELKARFGRKSAAASTKPQKSVSCLDILPDDLLEDWLGNLFVCEEAEQLTFDFFRKKSILSDSRAAGMKGSTGGCKCTHSGRRLRAVSLFSGAGGLDVGFEQAGYEVVFANEFDHDAAEAWRVNRPNRSHIMVEGDINIHIDGLSRFRGVDIVFGGPPCQGFSVAGKMNPNDPRSNLVWRFMDVVEIVNPKVFVMENVSALAELDRWRGVRRGLVSRANALGYETSLKVYHTPDFGVPENRDRMIFIGVRENDGCVSDFHRHLQRQRREPPTVRDVLLSAGRFGSKGNPDTCSAGISLARHPVMRRSPYAGMLVNGAGRPIDLDGVAPTLPASMGGNKTPIVDEKSLHDSREENWFAKYHRKLLAGSVSPDVVRVPSHLRRLTVKESALIQTFPDGYSFVGKKTKQYRQIGNAVPCRFAYAVACAAKDAFFS